MEKPELFLTQFFQRNGYVRVPNRETKKELGKSYKKGYEVRFVLETQSELDQVRDLLMQAGFKPGKPFKKHSRIIQPVYGKRAVGFFQPLLRNTKGVK